MKQLGELQSSLGEFEALGVRVVAIVPDTPDLVKKTRAGLKLEFPIYADPAMETARKFGIAFEQTDPRYKQLLESASGLDHHLLPVPSVFLVGANRKIDFCHIDPVYQRRPPPGLLLAAVKAFAQVEK